MGAALATTMPLVALIKHLIQERVIDRAKASEFLTRALEDKPLPADTKAMVSPIWKSAITEIQQVTKVQVHSIAC